MEDWKNDEIQTILRYNWARGLTPSECIVEMQPNTGDNCPNHEVISRRFENFDSNDSEARAIMSNTSGAQIDPLQVNVEGQVAERKQQIDFGRPIEAENGKEKNADAKENFENSSENDPVMKFAAIFAAQNKILLANCLRGDVSRYKGVGTVGWRHPILEHRASISNHRSSSESPSTQLKENEKFPSEYQFPYQCKECGSQFRREWSLERHKAQTCIKYKCSDLNFENRGKLYYVIRLGNFEIWKEETLDLSDSTMSAPDVFSESAGESEGTTTVIKCSSVRSSKCDIQPVETDIEIIEVPDETYQLTASCVKCNRKYECNLDTPMNFCRECVNPLTYKCKRCHHWFRTFNSARSHRASSCRPWVAQSENSSNSQQSQKLQHPCHKCAYVADNKSTLQRHLVTEHRHKRHVCLACGRYFDTLLEVARHAQTECDRSALSCDHCKFKCNKKVALFNHIQREHRQIYPEREFDCRFCGKTSHLSMISLLRRNFKQFAKKTRPLTRSRADQQDRHREKLHLEGRSELEIERIDEDEASSSQDSLVFPASLGLVSRQELEQHQQRQEQLRQLKELSNQSQEPSQQREFRCRFCGKGYRWKSTMRRHESLECGDKEPSFQCPECPYKARQRGNLTVHYKRHHQME
ncbi:hypothetical protein QAD02_022634 [Eretmocerus hayati]|uniref:Uncharacterized protein n=1 Tax=Eretmocerus hayati TaxID=131215 RepID=A0ACC2PTV7_9HYME|nr:hypothetical protein QAD02_022634 [Eretmocerus hayati]